MNISGAVGLRYGIQGDAMYRQRGSEPCQKGGLSRVILNYCFLYYLLGNEGLMLVWTHPTLHLFVPSLYSAI